MKGIFEKKDKFNFFAKRIKNFYGYPPLFHPHCEIFFVISGEIEMTVDGKAKTLKAGEISTVFPYTVHSYENAPDAELYMIMFEPDALGTFEAELLSKKPICPYLESSAYLEPMFARAAEFMYDSDGVRSKLAVSYLSVIVGELLNTMPLQDTESLSENKHKKDSERALYKPKLRLEGVFNKAQIQIS